MEPFYIAQTNERKTPEGKMEWFRERAREAQDEGAKLCRFSQHQEIPDLILVEGWKALAHEVGDQGDIRWQLGYADNGKDA